jgi:hypothetical protein
MERERFRVAKETGWIYSRFASVVAHVLFIAFLGKGVCVLKQMPEQVGQVSERCQLIGIELGANGKLDILCHGDSLPPFHLRSRCGRRKTADLMKESNESFRTGQAPRGLIPIGRTRKLTFVIRSGFNKIIVVPLRRLIHRPYGRGDRPARQAVYLFRLELLKQNANVAEADIRPCASECLDDLESRKMLR